MTLAENFEVIADKVYEKGKTDENKVFWDAILAGVLRGGNFMYAFHRWGDIDVSPLDGIEIKSSFWMFSYSAIADINITLNLSTATSINQTFADSGVTKIKKIILPPNGTTGTTSSMFSGCKRLEYIRLEGYYATTIDFGACPLDAYSILGDPATEEQIANGKNLLYFGGVYYFGGIMGALMDEPTAANQTITFKKSVVDEHFGGEEGDMWLEIVNSKPNWNFAVKA